MKDGGTRIGLIGLLCLALVLVTRPTRACVGDCSGDGRVTVDEIATLIAIGIGERPLADCTDPNGDGAISIEEIVGSVGNSLRGCPRSSRRYLYPAPQLRGGFPIDIADVDHDGDLDFVFPGWGLINGGDGSFSARSLGRSPADDVAFGDFDGDDRTDFAVVVTRDDVIRVVLSAAPASNLSLPTGDQPVAVAAADIDGDGDLDLVAANSRVRDLTVYLGTGAGTFIAAEPIPLDFSPASLELVDLDDDGRAELVVPAQQSSLVAVLRLTAGGIVEAVTRLESANSGGPSRLLVADLDLDGQLDLTTINVETGASSFWRGNGDGTFREPTAIEQLANASAVATGDFNGDGIVDLAVGSAAVSGDVGILLGQQPCGSGFCATFPTGEPVRALVAGDFTADGRSDLAIIPGPTQGSSPSNRLTIIEGNGDGTFVAPRLFTPPRASSFRVADFNADHLLDVVGISGPPTTLTYYWRTEAGAFEEAGFWRWQSSQVPIHTPELIALGDFDGDGFIDTVALRVDVGRVVVFWGGEPLAADEFAVGAVPRSVVAHDLNRDGRDDIVTANSESDDLTLLLAAGDRDFDRKTLAVGDGPWRLTVGDIDGDGRPDIAAANELSKDFSIRLAGQDSSFAIEKRLRPIDDTYRAGAILARDLTGDGFADLILEVESGDFLVLIGDGDGTFRSPRSYPAVDVFGEMDTADANGDGYPDLFIRDLVSTVGLWLGDGQGEFAGPFDFGVGAIVDKITARDADGDGVPDLLASNYVAGFTQLRGSGCTDSQPAYTLGFPQGAAKTHIPVVADINGDGFIDLVGAPAGLTPPGASVFFGSASGGLGGRQALPESEDARGFAVGDLDGDGVLEIVTANTSSDAVSSYSLEEDGSFSRRAQIPAGDSPRAVVVADINDDSDPDIVALNGSGTVTVLLRTAEGQYERIGSFGAEAPTFGIGNPNQVLVAADFDHDGTLDLAVPHATGIGILPGRGDGHFEQVRPVGGMSSPAHSIIPGDYNEDGRIDLASTNAGSALVSIALGQVDGSFRVAYRVAEISTRLGLANADLDADGHLDLVTTANAASDVGVVFGNGDGTFGRARRFGGQYSASSVAIGDFDGDGDADVLTSSGPDVWMHAGMWLPCALPHQAESQTPHVKTCVLEAEGGSQTIECR